MEIKQKLVYDAPDMEVVEVRIENQILQPSGGLYQEWEGEDI